MSEGAEEGGKGEEDGCAHKGRRGWGRGRGRGRGREDEGEESRTQREVEFEHVMLKLLWRSREKRLRRFLDE